MKVLRPITFLMACAAVTIIPGSALAQRQPPTSEQRIERLERQLQQVQRQVFPRGRPAETAGFSDEPAATQSSVVTLDQRLDSLERQLADMLRQTEENGNRLRTIESDIARLRTDQEARIATLERRADEAAAAAAATTPVLVPVTTTTLPGPKPKPQTTAPAGSSTTGAATPAGDPGEDAYSEGFRLWESGQHDQAIAALRAFTTAYPKHRRVSYANNLIGRALLDKGDARGAAAALLANYRNNPKGERASDSLFYLGQALMQLGQPGQACKAYGELEDVYAKSMRADLRKLLPTAKAQAQCS